MVMRSYNKQVLIVLLIMAGLILFSEEKAYTTPKIQFESINYDFGKVKEGEKVRHLFKFKNIGDEPLHIKKVISTCDCTAAIVSKKILVPQEEGEIEAVFDSTKKVTNETKLIKVSSNDPNTPHLILTMKGEVIPEIKIEPQELNFGEITYNRKEIVKTLKISFPANDKLEVKKITQPHSKYIKAKIVSKKQGETIIEVKIKGNLKVGRLTDSLSIFTTSKIYPVKRILIVANVKGDILIKPNFLLIGEINENDKTWNKEVILSKQQEGNFKIKKVEDTNNAFSTEIFEIRKGKEYKIKLTLKPNLNPGKVMGKLKVYTDLSYQEIIEIPIYGMIKKG